MRFFLPRLSIGVVLLTLLACNAPARSGEPTAWPTIDAQALAQTQAAMVTAVPTNLLGPTITPEPSPTPRTHTVSQNETLTGIATIYGIDLNVLLAANHLMTTDTIVPGQVLVIPNSDDPLFLVTGTPALDPTVAANPLADYSIDALTVRDYGSSTIEKDALFARNTAYEQWSISYMTPEFETGRLLWVTALMNVPVAGEGPYPVVILLHGGIDQNAYEQGDDTAGPADYLARAGYLTIAPDYRTYNETEGSGTPLKLPWVVDTLALIDALPSLPEADPQRIGVMGHSRGGGIAGYIMVCAPQVDAVSLYAPLHMDQAEVWNIYATVFGSRWPFDDGAHYGTPETNPLGYQIVSPYYYLNRVQMPVQIHHGTLDGTLPVRWSRDLADQLQAAGKTVEYWEYPNGNHTLVGDDYRAMLQRTQAFFDVYVK